MKFRLRTYTSRIAIGIVLSLVVLTPAVPADALSGSSFRAGNIMDDSIFFNNSSMSAQQIQFFLNAKVPVCDTNGTQAYGSQTRAQYGASRGNPAPYTCLKDYSENTPARGAENGLCQALGGGLRSSAQILYDVAQACSINPQVLLVLLQKEQSLVTDDWPWNIQYRSATGYGCPDTAACDSQYYGFFNQVYMAARQFKRYARDASTYSYRAERNNMIGFHPNGACGASSVYIQNQATAGLYVYTPYQPNQAALNNLYGTGDGCSSYGNRNFWRMFSDWFGSTNGSSLVQGSSSTVYLVSGSKKYGVPSVAMLDNYRLNTTHPTPSSDAYLNSLTDGGILGTLFTIEGDPTVYLADHGMRFGIPSSARCVDWGINCANVQPMSYAVANRLPDGGILQNLMSFQSTAYKVANNTAYPYLSTAALTADAGPSPSMTEIKSIYNLPRNIGTPIIENGALAKFGTNPTIFFHTNGHFYGIPSGTSLNNWFANKPVYHDHLSLYAITPPAGNGVIPHIAKHSSTNQVYVLDRQSKINITASSGQWPAATSNSEFDALLASYPTHATDTAKNAYRTPSGAIFIVKAGKRNVIASMHDFYSLGYGLSDIIGINEDTFSALPVGDVEVGEGSVFKVSGSSAIYLKGPDQKVYYLRSQDQLGQFQLVREDPLLPPNQLDLYSAPEPLSSFVTTTSGGSAPQYLVDAQSKVWLFGTAQAQQWGVTTPALTYMKPNGITFTSLSKTNTAAPAFAFYQGAVFYGSGGQKRPITSQAKYLELGGNASNTFPVTRDFLDATPTGPVY